MERKRIARQAAAARWGSKTTSARPEPYRDLEPADAILLAAINLFSLQGYDAPTLQEIADAAGVGLQTIYRFYPTKFALYQEAFNGLLKGQMLYFRDMVQRNRGSQEQLYALALGMCYTHTNPHLIRLVYRELLNPDSDVVKGISFLPEYVQPYLAITGDMASPEARGRILQLLTTIQGFAQWVPVRDRLPEMNEILKDFESVARFSLQGAFPDVDWDRIRPRVVFEPFDLARSVLSLPENSD